MTKLLEKAIEEIRKLPPEQQDEIGAEWIQSAAPNAWTPAHLEAMKHSIASADAGDFATDAEIAALRAKYPSA